MARDDHDLPAGNAELAERMVRVESKLDHQAGTLERIADGLEDATARNTERIEQMEPQVGRLWMLYQAAKWTAMIGSSGGLLALVVSALS